MNQYLLNIMQPDGPPPAREQLERIMGDVTRLRSEMKSADAWVFSGGLQPPAATKVVRPRGAQSVITDGPYAEAKEHIGGFTVIRAATPPPRSSGGESWQAPRRSPSRSARSARNAPRIGKSFRPGARAPPPARRPFRNVVWDSMTPSQPLQLAFASWGGFALKTFFT